LTAIDNDVLGLPTVVAAKPITGNGLPAIRDWVTAVERHFGGQNLATCHYAALLGYRANLKTFRVESSDRAIAKATGMHRDRLAGHNRRLVDAGFLLKKPRRRGERGTQYVLSIREEVQL